MAKQDKADGRLKEKILEILRNNGIKDEVAEVSIFEPDHLKGEHMATATLYVEVKFKKESLKPKNLFAKRYFNYQTDSNAKEISIMENEASFYTKFIPAANEFCKKQSGSELLTFFPKCLYGDAEFIVLDNVMLNDGYTMVPKLEQQNYSTSKHVMRNLAKFHAVSYAMAQNVGIDEFKKQWEILTRELLFDVEKTPTIKNVFDSGISTCISILKEYPVDGGEETIKKLSAYLGNTWGTIETALSLTPKDPLFALNHGDCWNNNMMFKMGPNKEIQNHILVDFQITRFGSPCMDLAYYLFTSVKPDVRRTYLKDLLKEYLASFKSTCEALNAECSLTFDDLYEDFKKRSPLGFFSVLMTMSTLGAMKEMDMSSVGENPTMEQLTEMFQNAIRRWIEKNPDLSANVAKEAVASLREYLALTGSK